MIKNEINKIMNGSLGDALNIVLKEHIEKRIQNYVWKVLTGKKLNIEDLGGYSGGGIKNRRW